MHELPDVARLIDQRRARSLTLPSCARPAGFADQDGLAGEVLADMAAGGDDVLERVFDVDRVVFPERQDVHGDEVDFLCQAVVPGPEFPHVGIGDRYRGARLRAADQGAHLVLGALASQQHFVADDERAHHIGVGVGQCDGAIEFGGVLVDVVADPGTEQHLDADAARDLRHLFEPLVY